MHYSELMLDDLKALVEIADAGSLVLAADRVCRTPSAMTRKVQRLEAALGAELLDRSIKPPRLNAVGRRVLEQGRNVLREVDALRGAVSLDSEPIGLLRLGISHALADGDLALPIRKLTERFKSLRLQLCSDLTAELFAKLASDELDAAAVLLPTSETVPPNLIGMPVSSDQVAIVGSDSAVRGVKTIADLAQSPWVLNPQGCLLRRALISALDAAGIQPAISAEVHNMHLQMALVAADYGFGLLPMRFLKRNSRRGTVRPLRPELFSLKMTVSLVHRHAPGVPQQVLNYLGTELRGALS